MEEEEAAAALVGASAGVYGLCGMCLVDVVEDLILMVLESYSSYEGKLDRTKALSCNIGVANYLHQFQRLLKGCCQKSHRISRRPVYST